MRANFDPYMTDERTHHRTPPSPGCQRASWKVSLARAFVRMLGWQIRGKLPPQFWRSTLVVWAPKRWQLRAVSCIMPMKVVLLQAPPSDAKSRSKETLEHFVHGKAMATATNGSQSDLLNIQQAAAEAKSRLALCAWEPRRRFVHVHAPFKTSAFADRDVHYMRRYFRYFMKSKH